MTGPKPLTISQRQVTAILKGAAKAGVRLSIVAREGEVEFVIDQAHESQPQPPDNKREPNFDPPIKKRPSFDI